MKIRQLFRLTQFNVRSLLLLTAVVGIAIVYYQDRQQLRQRIELLEQKVNPSAFAGTRWGAEQATGKPDTPSPGDHPTAWAAHLADGGQEWIELTYSKRVKPKSLSIHESYNPGAVVKVTGFDSAGNEHTLWQGKDPTPSAAASGVSKLPVAPQFKMDRIRIYLDCTLVAGWNEIDAVAIEYGWRGKLWAQSAKASSSFGGGSTKYSFLGITR